MDADSLPEDPAEFKGKLKWRQQKQPRSKLGWFSQEKRERQSRREEELKRRLASVDVSLEDDEAFAAFARATAEQKERYGDVLASFFSWMTAGSTSKSAVSYMQQVKMLMERFQPDLQTLVTQEFLALVKKTKENHKRNNLVGAGLKKFCDFVESRGGLSLPWEAKAAACDERFRMDFQRWNKKSVAQPTGRSLLTTHFAVKRKEPEEAKEAKAPEEVKEPQEKAKKTNPRPRKIQAFGKRFQKGKGESKEACQAPATEPARAVATPQRSDVSQRASRRESGEQAASTPPSKGVPVAEETPEKPAPALRPSDMKEISALRSAMLASAKQQNYAKAKELKQRLLKRCEEIGCPVPTTTVSGGPEEKGAKGKRAHRKERDDQKNTEEGCEDAEPMDRFEFARGILKEKFPLRFLNDCSPEDDAEILQENERRAMRRAKKEEDDQDEDAEEDEEQRKAHEMKKALSSIPDASVEDVDRFPAVAATFREWLSAQNMPQEDVEASVQVLHDLFTQDEKSLDAMAEEAYVKVASKQESHAKVAQQFAAFWAERRNGPWCPAPARVERKLEARLRLQHMIPETWSLRVVQRANKEDLVILTAPDGTKQFAETSKFAEHPVFLSKDFQAEQKRRSDLAAATTELEQAKLRLELEKGRKVEKPKVLDVADATQAVQDSLSGSTEAKASMLRAVLRQHLGCSSCGRLSTRELERMFSTACTAEEHSWSSYDDVPDASPEDVQQYPRVLATFFQQGYPYMNGVRRLMELHKKTAWDMATPAFQRLVRMDPENARCNGYLNSAILYLRKFRETGGFDHLTDVSSIDPYKLQKMFTPDFDRETGKEQEHFDDLQVDMPLELVMADATENWLAELREKVDYDGYLHEDVDARGQRPVALSVALLADATDEEWALWPRILAKFEQQCKQDSEEDKPIKREAEADALFLAMKDLVEEHGKSPDAMAAEKYLKIIKTTYTSSSHKDRAVAVAKFADFWVANKDGEFPEPKVHIMAVKKYQLMDRQLVEQAKQTAAEWLLPAGWAVKLGRDGRLIKVTGPGGKTDFYRTKEAALEAVEGKAKRQAETAKARHEQMVSAKEAHTERTEAGLRRQLAKAVREEDYDLAERLHAELNDRTSAGRPSRRGTMPIVARSAEDVARRKGTGRGVVKRKTDAEDTNPSPLKVRKAMGLKHQQKHEVARSELTLRAGEWRLQGVRLKNGSVVPLNSAALQGLSPDAVVLVLVYVDEEVRERKRRQIIEDWGLDDTWTVTVRYRLSGHQVTAKRADGKVFLSKHEVVCDRDREALEQISQQATARAQDVQALLSSHSQASLPVWELEVKEMPLLSGLYVAEGESFVKVSCLGPGDQVKVCYAPDDHAGGEMAWKFMDTSEKVLARTPAVDAGTQRSPFDFQQLNLLAESDGEEQHTAWVTADAVGTFIAPEGVVSRVCTHLGQAFGPCCRFCEAGRSERRRSINVQRTRESKAKPERVDRDALYESRLLELQQRRDTAPRTLAGMASRMLEKLQAFQAADSLPEALLQKKVLRIGTMCSGTDAPMLVARALERALRPLGSKLGFQHAFSVEYDARKQEFLQANFPECPLLFKDCVQMGRKRAWDVLSRKPQPIPNDLDILIAGFSCKDLSLMNSYRKALQEMGQSGSTLRGVLDYAERHRPRLILLENVWAITKSNSIGFKQVDLVMEGLKERGYAAGYRLLNSCDYFIPQIRHRIWMWAIRLSEKPPKGLEEAKLLREQAELISKTVHPKFNDILVALEEPCALHFEDYMLDDDHPAVRAHFQAVKAKRRSWVAKKKAGAKLDWTQKYDCHRTEHDYQYDRPYTAVRDAEFLQVLNEREKELVNLKCLDVMNEQGKDPRTFPMLWELSQSVERVPGTRVRRDRQNYASCILPGTLWHSSRRRWVLGIEKLALQGIFAEDLKDTDFPQKLLGDLAGNAFTTSVCAANLIALLTCSETLAKCHQN
ncbi:ngoBIM [Symbiodinium pilosum]|uniref:DNA (cytosine-5-)-methyltransferase n=1 Tax=Symbiodinium pilosum TaxID=2952 RepID=A0A812TRG0_SYMPI|nr:ngoBIM [Symbiodinium pilosum]